jgi:hypothetical protein
VTYDDLPDAVRANKGVLKLDMGALRDMQGAGKLGIYVRKDISKNLSDRGLGHFPEDLPVYQHEEVRVFERDSRIGRIVNAVLHPNAAGDKELRGLDGDDDDRDLLDQVRKLVGVGA